MISGVDWLAHRGSVGKVRMGEMVAFDDDGVRCRDARTVVEEMAGKRRAIQPREGGAPGDAAKSPPVMFNEKGMGA